MIKKFSKKELKLLQKNDNIQNITENIITYSEDFRMKFMLEHLTGTPPRVVFEKYGFDVEIIGIKRVERSASRWRKLYKKDGLLGLKDSRKGNSGRSLKRILTEEEDILKLKSKIKFLEMENDFLKKLKAMRGCIP